MQHNKLVRDKIPEICRANGTAAQFHTVTDNDEYVKALGDKLVEEAKEVQEIPSAEELADTLEVVFALGKALGFSPQDLERVREVKAETRGGFEQRIFLESTED